jgi:MHS family proline/betaine transporter-like MFS transporter
MIKKSSASHNKQSLLPIIVGNAIEYFNIFLFTFLATTFTKNFVPLSNKTFATSLYFFLIYFLPTITGLFGAYFLGSVGDKYGRKKALNFSILGMAICSIFVSLLPTYEMIGLLAPILLLILRSLQVFFAAGEYNGGIICCIERSSKKIHGTVSGIYCAATATGILFASFVSSAVYYFDENFWRGAFMLSGIITLLIYQYRKNIPENLVFIKAQMTPSNKQNTFNKALCIVVTSCFFCTTYGFAIKILPTIFNLQAADLFPLFFVNIKIFFTLAIYIIFLLISGKVCNLASIKNVMLYSCFGSIALCLVAVFIIDTKNLYILTFIETLFLINLAFFIVPFHIWTVSLFQIQERYKNISTSYSLGRVISNLMPSLLIFLWGKTASVLMLVTPVLILSILSIYAIKYFKGGNYV